MAPRPTLLLATSPLRDRRGALLTLGAIGLWGLMVGLYAAGMPDRTAEAEDPDRAAWIALQD